MTKRERIKAYCDLMPFRTRLFPEDLDSIGFFDAPASTKYHGAYRGGLFEHSYMVTRELLHLTNRLGLRWERPESPFIVGMYHDLCKCDNYTVDLKTSDYIYNPRMIIPGHGEKSVMMLSRYMRLTDEEIACIRWHMGAYETDTKMWEYYGRAVELYPNALYTHTADMIASRIRGV